MAKHKKELDQAFDLIKDFQSEPAVELIQDLNQDDLECSSLGTTTEWYLFDWAVINGLLDVANAIIERYALLTKDRFLKPLSIDYYVMDENTIRYSLNTLSFMSGAILSQYLMLLDEYKLIFVYQIQVEIKKLRVMAVEKLLELTVNLAIHNKCLGALLSYRELSIHITDLNKLILEAMNSLSSIFTGTVTFQELFASLHTADQLDEICGEFFRKDHYSCYSLDAFRSKLSSVLNHPSNNILKQSSDYKEVLARITDAGIGTSVTVVVSKSKEQSKSRLTFFGCIPSQEETKEPSVPPCTLVF